MQSIPSGARFLAIMGLLALALISPAQAQQPRSATSESSGPDFRALVEKETFLHVNEYRKENDLPLLVWSDAVAKEARAHSKDMATGEVDFGHDGFSDRVDHLKEALPGIWGAGENVLFTSNLDGVAKTAVTLWLHSPHHLKNIRGEYNYSGVGVWQDKNGVIYFTQLFVNVKPPEKQPETSAQPGINSAFGLLAAPVVSKTR